MVLFFFLFNLVEELIPHIKKQVTLPPEIED